MKFLTPIIFLLASNSFLLAQDKPAQNPDAERELIRQWVTTERLISKEKQAWEVEKKRMQELLDLYQKELKLLDEEISKAGASAGMVDARKGKLEAELKQYREARKILADTMASLLPRIRLLAQQLPKPLKDELAADIELILSEQALADPRDLLKSTLAMLSSAGRFNRTLTKSEETRELSGGKKVTVSVLYLGLARAYFAAQSGDVAGIGAPAPDGWKWEEQDGIADDVRRAIAVYEKKKQPQLVELPVKIEPSSNK